MRYFKKKIINLNKIPSTEAGDLLLMALSVITSESRTNKTPDEVLKDLQVRRFDVMYTDGG